MEVPKAKKARKTNSTSCQFSLTSRIHRLLQRPPPLRGRHHSGPQNLHPPDIRPLLLDVHLAHVDLALHLHQTRRRRQSHAMLPRPRLGDQLRLPHLLRQQRLSQAVIDLVRPRVVQILPLEVNRRAAQFLREVSALVDGRRTADETPAQVGQLGEEGGVVFDLLIFAVDLLHDGDERRREEGAAEWLGAAAEVAVLGGEGHGEGGLVVQVGVVFGIVLGLVVVLWGRRHALLFRESKGSWY